MDQVGTGLLSGMSIPEIAKVLDITTREFSDLWPSVEEAEAQIAGHLAALDSGYPELHSAVAAAALRLMEYQPVPREAVGVAYAAMTDGWMQEQNSAHDRLQYWSILNHNRPKTPELLNMVRDIKRGISEESSSLAFDLFAKSGLRPIPERVIPVTTFVSSFAFGTVTYQRYSKMNDPITGRSVVLIPTPEAQAQKEMTLDELLLHSIFAFACQSAEPYPANHAIGVGEPDYMKHPQSQVLSRSIGRLANHLSDIGQRDAERTINNLAIGELDEILDAREWRYTCLLYTSPSPRDQRGSRMPSSA